MTRRRSPPTVDGAAGIDAPPSVDARPAAAEGRLRGLPPVARPGARLLVLGSFPGVASLRAGRYYAHPRNQFWPIVGALLMADDPERWAAMTPLQRVDAVAARGLAIWDVYASCRRAGSLDSAIQDPELNDLAGLVQRLPGLRGIAHNGGESARVRRVTGALGLPVWQLPSTSPAHASWSLERKQAAWRDVFVACGLPRVADDGGSDAGAGPLAAPGGVSADRA